jgi:DNA primase
MIPNQFVQDLLARTDIVEIVGAHVTLRKTGANLSGLCPFHNEKSPSFSVSPTKQFYHCFGCGVSGSALGFLMEYSGYAFPEAVEELARRVGVAVPQETRNHRHSPEHAAQQADHRGQLLAHHALAAQYFKDQLKNKAGLLRNQQAVDYLKRRGLSGEIAARFGLGFAPDEWQGLATVAKDYDKPSWVDAGLVIDKFGENASSGRRYDRFRDRIMFPIRSTRGEIIGFGGRIIDQGEPKYLNSPETALFNKGQELYGLGEARAAIRTAGYALVTEGYMDVVALAQLGFPQAVATLGTAVGAAHVQKLFRYTDHIVFSFDGDGAGRKAAWRALEASLALVTDSRRSSFLFLPTEHDPDSFIRKEGAQAFEHAVAKAVPLSQFLLKTLCERHDISSAEGRAALLHDAKPMLQSIQQARMLRLQITKGLAQVTQIAPAEVEQFLEVGRLSGAVGRAGAAGSTQAGAYGAPGNAPGSPLKAQLDGRINRPKLSKEDWLAQQQGKLGGGKAGIRKSTGALAPQAGRAAMLGQVLLQAPQQFSAAQPWLDAWRADLNGSGAAHGLKGFQGSKPDEQTLVYLCDELVFVASTLPTGEALNETLVARHVATQAEQGAGSGLTQWLQATMSETMPPSEGDALRLAAGLREAQLQQLCQHAATQAGESAAAMQRYKDLTALHSAAKAACAIQTAS